MNYEALTTQFKEFSAQMEAARAAMSEKAKPYVEAGVQQLLEICPEIDSVFWVQYTPYFNDGDTCYFSVYEPSFILVGDDDYCEYEGSYLYSANDLEAAKNRLQSIKAYEEDPEAWRLKKTREYEQNTGRPYPYLQSTLRPIYSRESAQKELEEIETFFEKYSPEAVQRISTSFDTFVRDFSAIPEDILKAIYGDHVLVRINRTGTTVEEYNHE